MFDKLAVMQVSVLGGSGQIGSPLVSRLRLLNYEVHSIDIVEDTNYDLRNPDGDWLTLIQKSDFVYFLAFDVGGSTYLKQFEHTTEFLNNNLKIMYNVFNVLSKFQIPFVFASSQMARSNFSPYGSLKRLGEFYTQILGGFTCRFWNVYGVEEDEAKQHVISDFIQMAKREGTIKMKTNGKESRQFLYVEDCIDALLTLMHAFDKLDKIHTYDITSFEWTEIIKVAEIVAEYTGAKIEKSFLVDEVQLNSRHEPTNSILDYWKPKTDLKKGIGFLVDLI